MSTSARRYRTLHPSNVITAHDRSSIYASAPFKFIIDGNPLYIHAELVSQNSKPLNRMINGYMSEAQEGFAVMKDVDEGTFVRFIQWAYSGYYDAGKFKIDSPMAGSALIEEEMTGESYPEEPYEETVVEERVEATQVPATQVGGAISYNLTYHNPARAAPNNFSQYRQTIPNPLWQSIPSTTQERKKLIKRNEKGAEVASIHSGVLSPSRRGLKESFINWKPTVCRQAIRISTPRPNQASDEDYTEVFLSHARVYVFAEKYDIQLLRALALDELHGTLQNFNLHPERTGDIIALLRYVYANTGESADGVEDMRTVMKHYVGFEMDTLMKDNAFGDFMVEDGGALLGDFLKMVEQRI